MKLSTTSIVLIILAILAVSGVTWSLSSAGTHSEEVHAANTN